MYVKLYSSIIFSTIWSEDFETRVVWITLLAMADREGFVYGSSTGIAKVVGMPVEQLDPIIAKLTSEDPRSTDAERFPENKGRRLEKTDTGWKIINYSYYRDLRDSDERRHQNKVSQRKHRSASVSTRQQQSALVSSVSLSDAEAEATPDTEPLRKKRDIGQKIEDAFEKWWGQYPRKTHRGTALKAWEKLSEEEREIALKVVGAFKAYREALPSSDRQFTPHPASWLNAKAFLDDPKEWKSPEDDDEPGERLILRNAERERNEDEEDAKNQIIEEMKKRGEW